MLVQVTTSDISRIRCMNICIQIFLLIKWNSKPDWIGNFIQSNAYTDEYELSWLFQFKSESWFLLLFTSKAGMDETIFSSCLVGSILIKLSNDTF